MTASTRQRPWRSPRLRHILPLSLPIAILVAMASLLTVLFGMASATPAYQLFDEMTGQRWQTVRWRTTQLETVVDDRRPLISQSSGSNMQHSPPADSQDPPPVVEAELHEHAAATLPRLAALTDHYYATPGGAAMGGDGGWELARNYEQMRDEEVLLERTLASDGEPSGPAHNYVEGETGHAIVAPTTMDSGTTDLPFGLTVRDLEHALHACGYAGAQPALLRYLARRAPSLGGISNRVEFAMFLAHVVHESGGLRVRSEVGCPEQAHCRAYQHPPAEWNPNVCGMQLNEPCRQQPYQGSDGIPEALYYGRGLLHLAWPGNYEAASWALFGDDRLYRRPELVADNPAYAVDTALWFWKVAVRNQARVERALFGATTAALNGPVECAGSGPGGAEIARRRFDKYTRVHRALGVDGQPLEQGCY